MDGNVRIVMQLHQNHSRKGSVSSAEGMKACMYA